MVFPIYTKSQRPKCQPFPNPKISLIAGSWLAQIDARPLTKKSGDFSQLSPIQIPIFMVKHVNQYWLVVDLPLWNMLVSWDDDIHVPNHQPEFILPFENTVNPKLVPLKPSPDDIPPHNHMLVHHLPSSKLFLFSKMMKYGQIAPWFHPSHFAPVRKIGRSPKSPWLLQKIAQQLTGAFYIGNGWDWGLLGWYIIASDFPGIIPENSRIV